MGLVRLPGAKQQTTQASGEAPAGARGAGGGNPPVVVTAAEVRNADVPVTLDAIGTVTPLATVTVRPQVDGKLIEVDFKEGQDVKAGDVLARIDPSIYQAQYDQAVAKKAQDEAQLANAKIDLDRYAKLAQGNFGPKQQADTQKALVAQLDAQVKQDQAQIDNYKTTLGFTTIVSPLDGRTGIRQVDPGNVVQAASATGIVVITQLKPMSIVFTLAQQNLRAVTQALAKGPLVARALDSDNSKTIENGQVTVVDNQVDPTTGTVKIRAVFPNAGLVLWPGQFVNVRLTVDTIKNAVAAPTAAVQRGPNGAYVYVLGDDGVAAQTNVTVGQQNEQVAVIQSGLSPGVRVATSGFARLTNGSKTRVIAGAPQAAEANDSGTAAGASAPADPAPGQRPERGQRRGGAPTQ
ncbi:MAG: efflux RND transporter periplasmic adaptor subunit [Hyphomicrobiales bacterium]|nr:efflux RND transporter periplasmic adaptor subunit [Hyphomicrobiales bacterium]